MKVQKNGSLGSVDASPTATVPLKGSVLTTVASAKLSLAGELQPPLPEGPMQGSQSLRSQQLQRPTDHFAL